jgi:branched-chain amino acid aminotransferase
MEDNSLFAFVQDRFVPEARASLPLSDLAIQRGYGVFDFFRVQDGRPLFLSDHLTRLDRSAGALGLALPMPLTGVAGLVDELIARNNTWSAGIRITLTGGSSTDGYTPGTPCLLIQQQRYTPPTTELRQQGIALKPVAFSRTLPQVKSIDYLMGVSLQPALAAAGYQDALYHNESFLLECPRSNLFLVLPGGRLLTPGAGVLAGITRQRVLTLARSWGMEVEEDDLPIGRLREAVEVFVTSTSRGALSVCRVGDQPFETGASTLAARFQEALDGD